MTLDVNQLVSNFTPLLRQAVGEAVTVELDLADAPLTVDVDSAQLETALLNLAVNARDAMAGAGALTIRTGLETPRGRKAGPPLVRIEVTDTGPGIAAESLERIFEPFFTTKEVGKGSGLGLSQVYGFVQQSGGQIAVDNAPGAGACFVLRLPRSDRELPEAEPERAPAGEFNGRGRLLVVEDDRDVLVVTVEMLKELGYEVTTACDAASAMSVLENGTPVDLLLSDVVMPGGRNGVQLAESARELRPGLKVLLSSGYVGEAVSTAGVAFEIIDKPYERGVLASKLRELLSATEQPEPRPRRARAAAESRPRAAAR